MKYTLVINELKVASHIKKLSSGKPELYSTVERLEELELDFESCFEYEVGEKIDLSELDERINEIYISDIIKTKDKYIIKTYKSIIVHDENSKFVQDEYRQLLEEYCQKSLWERIKHTKNKVFKLVLGVLILGSILLAVKSGVNREILGCFGWIVAAVTSVNALLMELDIEHMEDEIID